MHNSHLAINKQLTYVYEGDTTDYWQTPEETRQLLTGDCEDYVILKWSDFLAKGVDEQDLFFVLAKNDKGYHMMLRYNQIYYDNIFDYRGRYTSDFTIVDEFNRFKPSTIADVNNKFNDLLRRL